MHIDMRYIPFPAALKVHYHADYPVIPLLDEPDPGEVFERVICTKGVEWKYEGEYRIVRHLRSEAPDLHVSWKGQLAIASPNSVVGVTLGARISQENQEAILRMVSKRATLIPVWKAEPDEEQFAFTFREIV